METDPLKYFIISTGNEESLQKKNNENWFFNSILSLQTFLIVGFLQSAMANYSIYF